MEYETLKIYNEEEISVLMQALNHYMYNNPRVTKALQNKKSSRIFSYCFSLIFSADFCLFFKLKQGARFLRPAVLRHIFAVEFRLARF